MISHLNRARGYRLGFAVVGLLVASHVTGQTVAVDKSAVKLIVPFGAGTPIDVAARLVAQGMTKSLGRPVVVDNRPGAAGSIATEAVATAAPDGNTVLMTVNNTVTINPILYTKLRHDPMKDLAPVALVGKGSYLMVTSLNSGLRSVSDLVQAAQEKPSKINYASYGLGSMSHMCAEVFQSMAKVKLFHVPYRAGSLNDILGGQVDVGFEPMGAALPQVTSAKLNALAVTSATRVDGLPLVPSLGETFPGYECTGWVGVLVPAKTPAEVRSAIETAVLKVVATPEFAKQMKDIGSTPMAGTAQDFAKLVLEDHEKWLRVLKPLNLKLD